MVSSTFSNPTLKSNKQNHLGRTAQLLGVAEGHSVFQVSILKWQTMSSPEENGTLCYTLSKGITLIRTQLLSKV